MCVYVCLCVRLCACVCVWLKIRWALGVIISQPSSNQALSPPHQSLILIPLSLFHAYCGAEFSSFFPHLSPHVLLPTVNCNVYPLFLDSFPSSTRSREFPKVTGNEWGHSLLRQPEQSHAFLICSDTILHLSLSFPPTLALSFFILSPWASCPPATAWFTPSRDISPGTRKPRCPICPWCLRPALCVCI